MSRIGPCQAYERGGRIEYPLSGGRVSWNNIRDISNVQIAYSTEADPTSQDQFTPVGTNLTTSWVGSQCIQGPDFAGLGLAEGQQVTLQLSYQTGVCIFSPFPFWSILPTLRPLSGRTLWVSDAETLTKQPGLWPMYECADLTLLSPSSFSALNMTVPCENNVLTTQTRSRANPTLTQLQADAAAEEAAAAQASISAHAASYGYTQGGSSSGSGSKLSATEAGVVGAMTTLGVAIIALLSARLFGVVAFGKKAVKERQEQVPRVSIILHLILMHR